MNHKMQMKPTEAKILLWLKSSEPELHFAREMSRKFTIDYAFLLGTLGGMVQKGWIKREKSEMSGKVRYHLTGKADLRIAEALWFEEHKKEKNKQIMLTAMIL